MSEVVKTWTEWLLNSRFSYMNEEQKQQTLLWLLDVRDKILDRANLKSGDTVIDIGSGTGLLAFGAHLRLQDSGKIIVSDAFPDCVDACQRIAAHCGIEQHMEFIQADVNDIKLPDNSVDVVLMRSVLVHLLQKPPAIRECYRILKPGGRISVFEPIIRKNTRYYELLDPDIFPNYTKIREIEQKMIMDENDSLVNFDEHTLENDFRTAGFQNIDIDVTTTTSTYEVAPTMIEPWFNTPTSPGKPTLKQKFTESLSENETNEFIENLKTHLSGKTITLNSPTAYIYAEKSA